MEYAILIYADDSNQPEKWGDDERMQSFFAGMNAFSDGLEKSGEFVTARRLRPTESSTTVRYDGDRAIATDGPFAETKESLAGFFLVDCEDLDRALEIAETIPAARLGCIEVRPIWTRASSDD